ncbi:hypothetical protein G647_07185 [Cladophialophora carrionii CBS 160.54]|uniref:Uncharacterized protein n=1 Tax=Cladophialophora carrionii CBS 160.54 TaxID=1279043 RepID=V9D4C0_9EURO|nr:uncharacterized protein G647_07185 [Cladophialophora carrionii CBS 160.54]ETI20842.1 hypothetical protein G647_07185 [Cladophialophora carrionii CBS 160.54]
MQLPCAVRALFFLFLTIEAAPTPQTAGASGGDLSTLSGVSGPETNGDTAAALGAVSNSGYVTAANAGDVANVFSGNNNTENNLANENEIVPVSLNSNSASNSIPINVAPSVRNSFFSCRPHLERLRIPG